MLKINKAENFDREGKYCHSNKWRPLWLRQVKENHCRWHQLPPRALCGPRSPPERSQYCWLNHGILYKCYWIKSFFLAPPWENGSDESWVWLVFGSLTIITPLHWWGWWWNEEVERNLGSSKRKLRVDFVPIDRHLCSTQRIFVATSYL